MLGELEARNCIDLGSRYWGEFGESEGGKDYEEEENHRELAERV